MVARHARPAPPSHLLTSNPPKGNVGPASPISSLLSLSPLKKTSPRALYQQTCHNAAVVTNGIPGFQTSSAFFQSLRTNLYLANVHDPFNSPSSSSTYLPIATQHHHQKAGLSAPSSDIFPTPSKNLHGLLAAHSTPFIPPSQNLTSPRPPSTPQTHSSALILLSSSTSSLRSRLFLHISTSPLVLVPVFIVLFLLTHPSKASPNASSNPIHVILLFIALATFFTTFVWAYVCHAIPLPSTPFPPLVDPDSSLEEGRTEAGSSSTQSAKSNQIILVVEAEKLNPSTDTTSTSVLGAILLTYIPSPSRAPNRSPSHSHSHSHSHSNSNNTISFLGQGYGNVNGNGAPHLGGTGGSIPSSTSSGTWGCCRRCIRAQRRKHGRSIGSISSTNSSSSGGGGGGEGFWPRGSGSGVSGGSGREGGAEIRIQALAIDSAAIPGPAGVDVQRSLLAAAPREARERGWDVSGSEVVRWDPLLAVLNPHLLHDQIDPTGFCDDSTAEAAALRVPCRGWKRLLEAWFWGARRLGDRARAERLLGLVVAGEREEEREKEKERGIGREVGGRGRGKKI